MERNRFKSIILGCNSNDIEPLVKRWSAVTLNRSVLAANFGETKRKTAESLLKLCENRKYFKSKVDELDLIYTQTYSKRRLWQVFRLENKKDEVIGGSLDLCNPMKFKKKLRRQMELYFDNIESVCVRVYNGALWVRICIGSSGRGSASIIYMVYFPKTEYIIISKYKTSVEEFLHQSIVATLGISKITMMQLTGHDLDSLIQLAMKKSCQGVFSKFAADRGQNAPFIGKQPKKRKAVEIERNDQVICEDEAAKKKRAKILEESFGQNEQPCLEKLEYKVLTKFRGTDLVPSMANRREPFKCTIKFEGTSVLEGIRNLGVTGLAKVPLPSHLANVHSLAKNHIVIQDQERMAGKRRK